MTIQVAKNVIDQGDHIDSDRPGVLHDHLVGDGPSRLRHRLGISEHTIAVGVNALGDSQFGVRDELLNILERNRLSTARDGVDELITIGDDHHLVAQLRLNIRRTAHICAAAE